MTSRKRRSRFRFVSAPDALGGTLDCDQDPDPSNMEAFMLHSGSTTSSTEARLMQFGNTASSHSAADMCTGEPSTSWDACHSQSVVEDGQTVQAEPSEEETAYEDIAPRPLPEMHRSLKITSWRVLWAVLMTSGSQKLTKEQYQSIRIIVDAFRRIPSTGTGFWRTHSVTEEELEMEKEVIMSLPHFSTLAHTYKKLLFEHLTVRWKDTEEVLDTRKAGARWNAFSVTGTPTATVRTVLPSEYARMDLSTTKVHDLMYSTSLSSHHRQDAPAERQNASLNDCVDLWPVVAARKYFYGPPQCISVDCDNGRGRNLKPHFAEVGDTISLSLVGPRDMSRMAKRLFMSEESVDGYEHIWGEILALLPVYHASRRRAVREGESSITQLSSRDRHIAQIFQFADYRSPSDLVTVEVPDLPQEQADVEIDSDDAAYTGPGRRIGKKKRLSPEMQQAMRERKNAIRRRKEQVEQPWINWRKPILKPGDVACLLRPCSGDSYALNSRFLLIHRFWVEGEERRRHVVWIPGDISLHSCLQNTTDTDLRRLCHSLTEDTADATRDVISCTIRDVHSGPRGPSKFHPVSSVGTLRSGERYFIYRFMLFWDGFEVEKGKSASGDGLYLVCLNLPITARSSSSAVRILSLCPPGIKSSSVFKIIQEDIVTGMTDGFIDYDATGRRCRIFLDLVGFLGDTPAINACLDILGHKGTACCHLCRYTKNPCHLGSSYGDEGSNGLLTGTGRSSFHHTAVHDSSAQKETCRLLGMKIISSCNALPLHSLQEAMLEAMGRIPKAANGIPILSGYLDPYRACYVAPDHLLTGHFRDCVNLAFRLLPTLQSRALTEKYMIGFLSDCDLKPQNRLFDSASKTLFSMSMTELYALSIVSEFSFLQAYRSLNSTLDSVVSRKCSEAISLVGSISRLIASLWRVPTLDRNASSVSTDCSDPQGTKYVARMQALVDLHLCRLRKICEMPMQDVHNLDDESISRSYRAEILKKRSLCLIAKRIIDKPNVHRLVELVYTTIPMIGHVSRVGELVLEKAHQTLKRAIRQGNHKNIQLLSMTSAVFSDWAGRLNVQLRGAMQGNPHDTLGFFRLLAGRQEVFATKAKLTGDEVSQVRKALWPPSCIPAVLESGNKTVFSTRADPDFFQNLSWCFTTSTEFVQPHEVSSNPHRARAFVEFKHAQRFTGSLHPQIFADELKAFARNGTSALTLRVGRVIELLCYNPKDLHFHIPFVIDKQSIGRMHARNEGSALWVVAALFTDATARRNDCFWAALYPCSRAPGAKAVDGFHRFNFAHFVRSTMSFTQVGVHMHPVGVLHDFNPSLCRPAPRSSQLLQFSPSTLDEGAMFFPITKFHGYPPRQG